MEGFWFFDWWCEVQHQGEGLGNFFNKCGDLVEDKVSLGLVPVDEVFSKMVELVHVGLMGWDVGVIELDDECKLGKFHFLDDSEPEKVEDVRFFIFRVSYGLLVEGGKLDHIVLTPKRL